MPSTLGEAYVHIIPTTEGISGSITSALSGESEKAGTQAGKSMLGGVAKVVGGGTALLAGAATAVAGSMISGAKGVAEYGDNIDKMSQKIGISAEEYQKWDYVLARAGTSIDVMKSGMKTLSTQAESNSEAFQKLGISAEDAANMSQADLFQKTVEVLSGMESGTERTALATQLLGKAGLELGPLLNEGTEAIAEQMEMAEAYGMIMSDDMVAASATYQDSMETLSRTLGGLKNNILGELLPSMTEVSDGLALIFSGNTEEGVEQITNGIQDIVQSVADAAPAMLEVGGQLILSLGQAFLDNAPELLGSLGDIMGQLFDLLMESAPSMLESGAELVLNIVEGIVNHLPDVLSKGGEIIGRLTTGITQNLPQIASSVMQIVQQLLTTLVQNLPQILQGGVQMLMSLVQGIISSLPQIASSAGELIGTLLSTLVQNLPQILSMGVELIGQLVVGIVQAVPQVIEAIFSLITSIGQQFINTDWGQIGRDLIEGIKNGITNAASAIKDAALEAAKKAFEAVKNFFGIKSPSKLMRDEIGRFIPAGIAAGIDDNAGLVTESMEDVGGLVSDSAAHWMSSLGSASYTGAQTNYGGFQINVYGAPGQDVTELADEIEYRINSKIQSMGAVYA